MTVFDKPAPRRVLFIHKLIFDYRLSFYTTLAALDGYAVTVAHSGPRMTNDTAGFREVLLPEREWGSMRWQRQLGAEIESADVVIALFDVHYLSSIFWSLIRPPRVRWIWWGIGFGRSQLANRVRVWLAKRDCRLALYMPDNLADFQKAGIPTNKLFCAPNTIEVRTRAFQERPERRTSFLLLGSLKRRKRADELLEAFALAQHRMPKEVLLEIVGDGECRQELQELAERLGVRDRCVFHGQITDEEKLLPILLRSIAMVSPGQAGLSILQSFAAGVAVVSRKDAISGGELANIHPGTNGILYSGGTAELGEILVELASQREKSVVLGKAAFDYYWGQMTVGHLIDGFRAAIESP